MKYLQRFYSYLLSQGGGSSHSLAIRVMSTLREGPVWSFREGPSASFDTKYFVWLLSFYKQKQVLFLPTIRWKKTMLRWFLRNNSCPTIFFKLSLNVPYQTLFQKSQLKRQVTVFEKKISWPNRMVFRTSMVLITRGSHYSLQ